MPICSDPNLDSGFPVPRSISVKKPEASQRFGLRRDFPYVVCTQSVRNGVTSGSDCDISKSYSLLQRFGEGCSGSIDKTDYH